jgi:hypothetical protein
MKKIGIKIDNKGNATFTDIVGFGAQCQEATADLERRLGSAVNNSRVLTADYLAPEIIHNHVKL